jgi:hypothetical protein
MMKLLLILLFSGSIQAATLVGSQHPMYFFDSPNEVFMCKSGVGTAKCAGRHKVTKIEVIYTCTVVTAQDGYIKDCKVSGAI